MFTSCYWSQVAEDRDRFQCVIKLGRRDRAKLELNTKSMSNKNYSC